MRPSISSLGSIARVPSTQQVARAVRSFGSSAKLRNEDAPAESSSSKPASKPSSQGAASSSKTAKSSSDLPNSSKGASGSSGSRPKSSRRETSSETSQPTSRPVQPLRIDAASINTFPSLLYNTSPVLDSGYTIHVPPTRGSPYGGSVTLRNSDPRLFPVSPPSSEALAASGGTAASGEKESMEQLSQVTGLSVQEVMALHRHALVIRRVTRMSGKGKVQRMGAFVVAGNGKGMVGYGEAKDANAGKAARKAFQLAVKGMDFVNRYEGRTVETTLHGQWGSTRIELRPRPPGFGLRVPPAIHAVARSAGMTDLSASIKGSANPASVVKATLQALWPGAHPLGLGDGLGGPARRTDKGQGARTREDIMRARGRRIVDVEIGPIVPKGSGSTASFRRSTS